MIFNAKFMILASLFAVVVSQQQPPACVLSCSQSALPSATNKTCTSFADPCVCSDMGFQAADGACLKANCSAADQAAALQLQQSFCGGSSNTTTTGTVMTTASGSASSMQTTVTMASSMTMSMNGSMTSMTMTPSSSGGSASGASSAARPSTSSGAGPQAEFGFFTLGVAAAGAVVGGMLL